MLNFNFQNPTKIVFGKDQYEQIDKLIPRDARVLITYGGGSAKKYGTLDKVLSNLDNRFVVEFGGIEPNPQYSTLMKAVKLAKENDIDYLLAVGGGSVIDGTKFISLAITFKGEEHKDLILKDLASTMDKAIPLSAVLTLPATGSEMNSGAVISMEEGKFGMGNYLCHPKFSILDPTCTYTLPKRQLTNGIVDTFVHVIEYYNRSNTNSFVQDRFAESILIDLIKNGKEVMSGSNNYDIMSNFMWSATMALNGILSKGQAGDWATHIIGHRITNNHGLDHAQALAIVLPSLWRVRDMDSSKMKQYALRVWGFEGVDAIAKAIDATEEFFNSIGAPTKLGDYDITVEQAKELIPFLDKSGKFGFLKSVGVTKEVLAKVFEMAK